MIVTSMLNIKIRMQTKKYTGNSGKEERICDMVWNHLDNAIAYYERELKNPFEFDLYENLLLDRFRRQLEQKRDLNK